MSSLANLGLRYYANLSTGATQWEIPTAPTHAFTGYPSPAATPLSSPNTIANPPKPSPFIPAYQSQNNANQQPITQARNPQVAAQQPVQQIPQAQQNPAGSTPQNVADRGAADSYYQQSATNTYSQQAPQYGSNLTPDANSGAPPPRPQSTGPPAQRPVSQAPPQKRPLSTAPPAQAQRPISQGPPPPQPQTFAAPPKPSQADTKKAAKKGGMLGLLAGGAAVGAAMLVKNKKHNNNQAQPQQVRPGAQPVRPGMQPARPPMQPARPMASRPPPRPTYGQGQRQNGRMGAGGAAAIGGGAGLVAGGGATALYYQNQQPGGGQWVDGQWGRPIVS